MWIDRDRRVVVLRVRELEHRIGEVPSRTVLHGHALPSARRGGKVRRNLRKNHAVVNPAATVNYYSISIGYVYKWVCYSRPRPLESRFPL